jgi:hypothetical protein
MDLSVPSPRLPPIINENEYVKENGKWFFSKIYWNVTFYTTYETGWLRFPMLGYFPFPDSDAPPTNFHPYPSGYKVPYHFPHPVVEPHPITGE